jgi:hypothetical protein
MLDNKKYNTKIQARKENVKFVARNAAYEYVTKGVGKLKLSNDQQEKLFKELVPVVEKRIQADRSKTAARVENISKTQEKKKMDKAKKLLG